MSEAEQTQETIKLVIKASGNKNFDIETNLSVTVSELKELLAEKSGIDAKQQRLIYSGRILKDPEPLSTYKIKAGNAVHLVKGAVPKRDAAGSTGSSQTAGGSSGTTSGGINGAPPLSEMAAGQETGNILSDLTGARYSGLANLPSASMFGPDGGQGPMPSMEDINTMLASNPELMDQVASMMAESADENSPLYQAMPAHVRQEARTLMSNPEIRSLMSDPQRLRQFMQASVQLQQLTGRSGPGLGGFGNGMGLFGGFPSENATDGENVSGDASTNPLAALGANGFGVPLGGFGAPVLPVDNRPPEERYETQLRQLNELGFFDFDRNVLALRRSGGNVEGAVEALLDGHV